MRRRAEGEPPLGLHAVPDQRLRRRRRDEPGASSRTSTSAPAWPTTTTRSTPGQRASEECKRLAEWIEGHEEVRMTAPGTDITLGIAGRKFIAADGKHNMPDGEFFTGADRGLGRGRGLVPPAGDGRRPRGRRRAPALRGAARSSTRAPSAARSSWSSLLDTDEGARRLGELGIGTNYGDRPRDPRRAARREDRRHRAHGGRRQLSGVRRQERERRPHGPGLRPAPRRPHRGRRRAAPGGRPVPGLDVTPRQ